MSKLTDLIDAANLDLGAACSACHQGFSTNCTRCGETRMARKVANLLAEHDAEVRYRAVKDVARKVYNGAGDREQELYDRAVAPWLEQQAVETLLTTPNATIEFVREVMLG